MKIDLGKLFFEPSPTFPFPFPEILKPWWTDFFMIQERCAEVVRANKMPPPDELELIREAIVIPFLHEEKLSDRTIERTLEKAPYVRGLLDDLDIPNPEPSMFPPLLGYFLLGWVVGQLVD